MRPGGRPSQHTFAADAAVKQAAEQLGNDRKQIERDLQVLVHLRAADAALADSMQPSVAIQKSFESVEEAIRFNNDFVVRQALSRARTALEEARRSPGSADFGRLRGFMREALVSASRVTMRNATRLHEESTAWLGVQEQISGHLRVLAEITGESLRASQEEER